MPCTVPPHGEVTIEVTIDLTERPPFEAALLSRPFRLRLTAGVERRTRPIRWAITGTCRSRVAVSSNVVNFGEANVAGRPPVSRSVTIFLDNPVDTFGAISSSDAIRAEGRPGPGGSMLLVITPDTARLRGDFSGTIRVEAIGPDGRPTGATTIAVEGTVREPGPESPRDGGRP